MSWMQLEKREKRKEKREKRKEKREKRKEKREKRKERRRRKKRRSNDINESDLRADDAVVVDHEKFRNDEDKEDDTWSKVDA